MTDKETQSVQRMSQLIGEHFPQHSPDEVVIDLLADTIHWCREFNVDFDRKLEVARNHVIAECGIFGRS